MGLGGAGWRGLGCRQSSLHFGYWTNADILTLEQSTVVSWGGDMAPGTTGEQRDDVSISFHCSLPIWITGTFY